MAANEARADQYALEVLANLREHGSLLVPHGHEGYQATKNSLSRLRSVSSSVSLELKRQLDAVGTLPAVWSLPWPTVTAANVVGLIVMICGSSTLDGTAPRPQRPWRSCRRSRS